MAYTKTTWVDRNVQNPANFTVTKGGGGALSSGDEVTLAAAPGTVTQAGTAVNAANLNKIETGIDEAHAWIEDPTYATVATVTQEITSLASTVLKGKVKTEIQGNTVVNILPDTVAGCEANTGWTASSGSIATDSSNEIQGTNCLKPVLGAASDTYDYNILSMLATGRYYLLSGYIKNGNATNIKLGLETDDQDVSTSVVTATTYNRVGVVIAPTDFDTASSAVMRITVTGSAGQYAYFDALMLQEITSAEYALGASALLTKYAFHLGTKSTDRIQVKSVGKNLFNKATVTEEYKIVNTTGALSASAGNGASDFIRITGGGSYKLSGTTGTTVLEGAYYDSNKNYISGFTSYTTLTVPANAFYIRFTLINSANDTAMLETGSTATTYTAYTETTAILPNELKKVSSTIYDTWDANLGKFTKNISDWVTLSGLTHTWSLDSDASAYKFIKTTAVFTSAVANTEFVIKSNGKKLTHAGDIDSSLLTTSSILYIGVADTETGWDESWVSGTSFTGMTWANLIKAYMNGWKLTTANTNVASCVWTGITSGTTQSAGAGYSHVIANIDTGFTPYKMIYQLATPVVTNYFPNVLNSEPSGTIYVEPYVEDWGVYDSGITITNSSYPISSLDYVNVINATTGALTPIALSTCTVAAGGLSFTSTALSAGDYVVYGYKHQYLSTVGTMAYITTANLKTTVDENTNNIRDLDVKLEQLEDKTNANDTTIRQKLERYGASSAGSDAYVVNNTYQTPALYAGMMITFKADVSNTGVATINVDGLGVKDLKKFDSSGKVALTTGDIIANGFYTAQYDGTDFIIINPTAILQSLMTAQGDMIYASAANTASRLAKGAAGSILKINTGATAPEYLSMGTAGQILEVNDSANAPIWRDKLNIQVFTASGTFTAPKTGKYKITTVGGGGSSAANFGGSQAYLGGGGGGGIAIEILSLTKDDAITVTIGAGGTAPSSLTANGNNGGTSSFGAYHSAAGGVGGYYSASGVGAGGAGGSGSGGDINLDGGQGGWAGQVGGTNAGFNHMTSHHQPYGKGGDAVFGTTGNNGTAGIIIIEY